MTGIVFHSPARFSDKGQTVTRINVDRDGKPFGQLWTFAARGERHGWHAKTLAGEYQLFDSGNKKIDGFDAMAWMNAFA